MKQIFATKKVKTNLPKDLATSKTDYEQTHTQKWKQIQRKIWLRATDYEQTHTQKWKQIQRKIWLRATDYKQTHTQKWKQIQRKIWLRATDYEQTKNRKLIQRRIRLRVNRFRTQKNVNGMILGDFSANKISHYS